MKHPAIRLSMIFSSGIAAILGLGVLACGICTSSAMGAPTGSPTGSPSSIDKAILFSTAPMAAVPGTVA